MGALLSGGLIASGHKEFGDFRVVETAFLLISGIDTDKKRIERTMVWVHILQASLLQRAGVVAARCHNVALDLSGGMHPY